MIFFLTKFKFKNLVKRNFTTNIITSRIKKHVKTKHNWHLVDPSPWPIMSSIAVFCLTTSGVLYMHNFLLGSNFLKLSLFILLLILYLWWRDVVREATFEELHNFSVQKGLRLGMILFIVSEIMFFFAFFWAFFHSSLSPAHNIGGVWPPENIEVVSVSGIPLTNTIFLLSSGATVTLAHHAIRARSKFYTLLGLIFTILLAVLFTMLQIYEYFNAPFNINDSVFGSCFYMTTGFHGFHVFIGTCCLLVSLIRTIKNHFTNTHHFGLESSIWYWHFVDVVWLFLFIAVYWWGC